LRGLKNPPPLLHGGQTNGHRDQAKRDLRDEVYDELAVLLAIYQDWIWRHCLKLVVLVNLEQGLFSMVI
jgi:hypothetical protein